ncbi:fumarylacetoacetate hydrolase family protein [Kibdelosporangium aridum]|uniref:fumarylacetoacetate hydrolase family protein n=1 Tax=Kibdelosporangium aridum TaxID=2030 RepID=UPI0005269A0B
MRIVRYQIEEQTGTGVVDGDLVRSNDEVVARLDEVRLLAPCEPRTIVCVGSNYPCQLAEKGRPWPERPALFLKAPNAVIGPWTETELDDPGSVQLSTRLGTELVQRSRTDRMIFGVGQILAYVTRWFTLAPGDVVLTGSPAGVGAMAVGDRVTVDIDGIGALSNTVVHRKDGP